MIGQRLAHLEGSYEQISHRLVSIDNRLDRIESRFDSVDGRFVQIEARFVQIDSRFAQIDSRFAQIEQRFDGRFAQIDGRFAQIDERLAKIDQRFDRMMLWQCGLLATVILRIDYAERLPTELRIGDAAGDGSIDEILPVKTLDADGKRRCRLNDRKRAAC